MRTARRHLIASLAALALVATGCQDVIEQINPPPGNEAQWMLAEEADLAPESTQIALLVREVECASGQSAEGRIGVAVDYREDEIVLTAYVRPLDGDQRCPSNPPTPFLLELAEPLGRRDLVNGATTEIASRNLGDELGGDGPAPDGPVGPTLHLEGQGELGEQAFFLAEAFWARAQDSSELGDLNDLSLHPDRVELILGTGEARKVVDTAQLADPAAWELDAPEGYAGFSGPFSVLETLRGREDLLIGTGEHDNCAGPPLPAPEGLDGLDRLWFQAHPDSIDSCIPWFAIDLWFDDGGRIVAIQLALFGP